MTAKKETEGKKKTTKKKPVNKEKMEARKEEIKKKKQAASRKKFPEPPKIDAELGGVKNPLLANKRLKRAMCCALAKVEPNAAKRRILVLHSGILRKKTTEKEVAKAEVLASNEWSGRGYTKHGQDLLDEGYYDSYKDKVNECMAFAKALKEAYKEECANAKDEPVKTRKKKAKKESSDEGGNMTVNKKKKATTKAGAAKKTTTKKKEKAPVKKKTEASE